MKIDGTIRDAVELPLLDHLQDMRRLRKRVDARNDRALAKVEADVKNGQIGSGEVVPSLPEASIEDDAIYNRNVIHYHIGDTAKKEDVVPPVVSPVPAPAPVVVVEPQPKPSSSTRSRWLWLIPLVLILSLLLAELAWYLITHRLPTIPTEAADTTIGLS
jgi:hypothetical protein